MPTPVTLISPAEEKKKIPLLRKVTRTVSAVAAIPVEPPKLRGRPSLLTEDLQAMLLSGIEEGLPLKQAAMLAGICYETLNRWRKKGESESAPPEFRHFCQALQRSEAVAMQRLVSQVSKAGNTDWRAAAWILERRHPDEFGKAEKIEHTGKGGNSLITPIDCEVIRRIKKQEGIKEMLGKLGGILDEVRRRRQSEASGD